MQFCIAEWESGHFEPKDLDARKQLQIYEAHFAGLKNYERAAADRLSQFRIEWFKYGL
jgi:hypothetical protein